MMRKSQFHGALALAFLACLPAVGQTVGRLTGFQAYLFNSKTGQFSQDVLKEGAPALGNVPSSSFSSTSTLVVVKVEFGANSPVPDRTQVHLVAIESGSVPFSVKDLKTANRTVLDRISNLGPVDEKGGSYIGFWLDSTGCRTITLKAFVVGVKNAAPLTGVLPFTCYE